MKKVNIFLLLCVVFFTSGVHARGGSEVGNGGDTIFCKPSNLNDFHGYYTLDYLLEYQTNKPSVLPNQDFETYKSYIRTNLKRIYPEVLPQFDDFYKSLTFGYTFNREWVKATTGLNDIKDENIIRKIPKNCIDQVNKPKLVQTVIRRSLKGKIQYNYAEDVLNHQKLNNPLQYSFFMAHEWMWDITRDVRILRKINWFLHSEEFSTISREDFMNKIDLWKLFRPKLNYCDRSKETQSLYPKTCTKIRSRDLRDVRELKYSNLNFDFLFPVGEFYGFGSVEKLTLNKVNLNKILNPRIFAPLYSLKHLALTNGNLIQIGQEVLRDLKKLTKLDLRGNDTFYLSELTCHSLSSLKTLKISAIANIVCLPRAVEKIVFDKKPSSTLTSRLLKMNPDLNWTISSDF